MGSEARTCRCRADSRQARGDVITDLLCPQDTQDRSGYCFRGRCVGRKWIAIGLDSHYNPARESGISNHRGSVMRAGNVWFVLLLAIGLLTSAGAREPWPTNGWPVAEPRAVGLDPKVLDAFGADIVAGKY